QGSGREHMAILVAWNGDAAEGDRVLEPLRALKPVVDSVQTKSYEELQSTADAFTPYSLRWYMRAGYTNDITEEFAKMAIEHLAIAPSPFSVIGSLSLGGAVADVGEDETAYPSRDAQYAIEVISVWA